jgi:hypothetical protein
VTRFITAIAASAALVLAAPFIGQLRAALQDTFPHQYRAIIVTAVFGSITVAIAYGVLRIRDRRLFRYGCIVAALTLGTGYALISRTGDPAIDAVERFHFVEYGLIALLFYRAWSYVDDASLLILPVLAAMLVGIAEEWLQWFIPARVGELHDVMLNSWAVGCGLLFALGLDPPAKLSRALPPASWRRVKRLAAVVVVALAIFLQSVHLGFRIDNPQTGSFRSTYDSDELLRLSEERGARWRTNPPLSWTRLSREDQYLTEGITHVRRRNLCWGEQNFSCAWYENRILEEYFTPVLDTPTYIAKDPHRWPPEQRADLEQREGRSAVAYVSEADDPPIWIWPRWAFWTGVAVLVTLLLI